VSSDALWCDTVAFERAISDGKLDEALQLWRGPLLPGFLPSDLPDFADWLDNRRRALDWLAADAARTLSDRATANGSGDRALIAARRWTEVAPQNEAAIRAFVRELDRNGQRAEARRTLDAWTARFERDVGAELEAETSGLVKQLRGTASPAKPVSRSRAVVEPIAAAPFISSAPMANPRGTPTKTRGSRRLGAALVAVCAV
jgi:DNA-binding SARP family transcriptional activator